MELHEEEAMFMHFQLEMVTRE
ncbi:MAG TPA: anti-sigma F factor antagonist, partial [Lysinibacillus sp.]|nr:anti-sigma F factor antagonist [Lysinibacillus sp.]